MSTKMRAALAALTFAVPMTATAVTTAYSYTGPAYSLIDDAAGTPGTYSSAMHISGTATFDAPLGSFLSVFDPVSPLAFSFTDGRVTVSNLNSAVLGLGSEETSFRFGTNEDGAITSWLLVLRLADPSPHARQSFNSNFLSASAFSDNAELSVDFATADSASASLLVGDLPGVWTVTAVPEPAAYVTLLAGLAVLVPCMRRMRSRRAA
jgi:hypothetical protein